MAQIGYKDDRVWPHLFHDTLTYLPYKWYTLEEVRGDTFRWESIKHFFVKYFSFSPVELEVEVVRTVQHFVED